MTVLLTRTWASRSRPRTWASRPRPRAWPSRPRPRTWHQNPFKDRFILRGAREHKTKK